MLTPNYDPNGLAPKILLRDIDGTLQYTFEAKQIAAVPTQDFTLLSGGFHLGVNDDFGYFGFVIDDHDNNFTDATSKSSPLIKQQWEVELWLGKDSGTLERWFYGTVIDVSVVRSITGMKQMQITCGGWGVKTKFRYTSIKRFQDKESDGISLDSTDSSSKVSEYLKDIFQDDDHYITDGLAKQTELTVAGVQDLDIKMADFQQTAQTWAGAASTLAAWSNSYWGIDPDRDVYLHTIGSQDSGFLFTNDLDGLDAQGWVSTKIGYLANSALEWNNSSGSGAFSVLHGLGGNEIKLDINVLNTPNSVFNLDTNWYTWKITPTFDNIEKIALSLNRTGTPASGKATFIIVGDDGSSAPNFSDVRGVAELGESALQALPTSGTNWVEMSFNIKGGIRIDPREELFIIAKRYGTASNTIGIENDTTVNTDYWSSTDPGGVGWTAVTGASGVTFAHRVYANRAVTVTLEDTNARRKYGTREVAFSLRQDIQVETIQEALVQAAETLTKEQRIYTNVKVTTPTSRIPLGKYVRIQDEMSGLDTLVDVIGVDGSFSVDDSSNVGVQTLNLTLQEIQG